MTWQNVDLFVGNVRFHFPHCDKKMVAQTKAGILSQVWL